MYCQHGDVLIEKRESFPRGGKRIDFSKGLILAHGASTGHEHIIKNSKAIKRAVEIPPEKRNAQNEYMFFELGKTAHITHEEHDRKPLRPGIYGVRKVRETDHFTDEIREVVD